MLGLHGGTQIGLEHGRNNLRTMTTNPPTGGRGGGGAGQRDTDTDRQTDIAIMA